MSKHLKLSEKPKRFCSECKREVYQTVHWSDGYHSDWYFTNNKTLCSECYKNNVSFRKTL